MAQPSGMVLGFPSTYGFFLLSSPFVCLLDTFSILLRLTLTSLLGRSPRTTLQRIFQRRFRDVDVGDESYLASLQKNAVFRLVLFNFGAVPQIVKLFAMRGIPWTQAFGAMYLASFLIMEVFIAMVADAPTPAATFDDVVDPSSGRTLSEQFFGGITLGLCASIPAALMLCRLLPTLLDNEQLSPFTICMAVVGHNALQINKATLGTRQGRIMFADMNVGVVIAAAFAPFKAFHTFYVLVMAFVVHGVMMLVWPRVEGFMAFDERGMRRFDGWYFMVRNVACAVLCYRYLYDPEGTVKPSWTDQLG